MSLLGRSSNTLASFFVLLLVLLVLVVLVVVVVVVVVTMAVSQGSKIRLVMARTGRFWNADYPG